MAKKNKGKVIQMLSPENYIRQKARTLPLFECRINNEWEETGLANITVARKHTNGNLTVGLYLIDLKCLGVKDAHYFFNISESQYRELLNDIEEQMETGPVSYTLAHNIIYAGIEFADDYGFKPHRDFTAVAQYILEEDTDDIELMEIECGKKGKPFYVQGPLDNDSRARQIIAQLERTAGPGNYHFIMGANESYWKDDDDDEEPEDDEFERQKAKFGKLTTSEKLDLIKELIDRIEKLSDEEKEDFGYLSNSILDNYVDSDEAEKMYDKLSEKIFEIKITDELSDELLGIETGSEINREEWKKQFLEIYTLTLENVKKAEKKLKQLQKEMPENPAVCFLELTVLHAKGPADGYEDKLDHYYHLFPEYPLLKLFWVTHLCLTQKTLITQNLFNTGPEEFFPGKTTLHKMEMYHYLLMLTLVTMVERNMTRIEVLDRIVEEVDIDETSAVAIGELITVARINFILSLKKE
jgi:hypothetical protein